MKKAVVVMLALLAITVLYGQASETQTEEGLQESEASLLVALPNETAEGVGVSTVGDVSLAWFMIRKGNSVYAQICTAKDDGRPKCGPLRALPNETAEGVGVSTVGDVSLAWFIIPKRYSVWAKTCIAKDNKPDC